jgi:hypothetical protein
MNMEIYKKIIQGSPLQCAMREVFLVEQVFSTTSLSPAYADANRHSLYNEKYTMGNFSSARKSMISAVFTLAVFAVAIFFLPVFAHAADFSVTPAVIDGKGKVREILRYTVTLENTSDHLVSLYPWVTDIDSTGGRPSGGDLSGSRDVEAKESLARWVEVTRGVIDLMPGERREVPVLVRVHLNAEHGIYHAAIRFSHGSNRADAEMNSSNTLETLLNIEVLEDKNVRLQLGGFLADKNFFVGDDASFSYSVENIGNRGVAPGGQIRIFDRKGEEVATLQANSDGKKIEPTEKTQLAAVWAAKGEFGRYKAMLDLEYGDRGTIQDTVFFWVLPWGRMLSYFLLLAMLAVIAALLFHSRMMSDPRRSLRVAEGTLEENVRAHYAQKKHTPHTKHRVVHHRVEQAPERTTRVSTRAHELSSHRVMLAARPKPRVNPAHVIDLKRRA